MFPAIVTGEDGTVRSSAVEAQGLSRQQWRPFCASLRPLALGVGLLASSLAGCGASPQARTSATPTVTASRIATPATSLTPFPVSPFAAVGEPVIANDVVYVTAQNGNLYALNASDGSLRWRYHADAVGDGPPTVANGVVYFGAQDASTPSGPNPPPSFLYAVDASSGALIWRVPGHWAVGKLIVANGVIYAGAGESDIAAFRASDGKPLWTNSIGGCSTNSLASDATYLYVSTVACAGVLAMRLSDGTGGWHSVPSLGGGAPMLADGTIYVGSSALRASDGTTARTFRASGEYIGTDAVANGTVFISSNVSLSAWNTTTGAQVWQISPQHRQLIYGLAHGVLYTGSSLYVSPNPPYDGHLYAFRTSDGTQLWSALVYPVIPQNDPLPASLGSTLYVGTLTGAVVALRASDGATLWRSALQ